MTTEPHASAELTDDALQGEIELVGDLVVAASSSEGPLTDEEIDAALGIDRDGSGQGPEAVEDGGQDARVTGGRGGGSSVGAQGAAHGQPRHIHV